MKLRLDEVRRLTGPNLLSDYPGAIVDVFVDEGDGQLLAAAWSRWSSEILRAFGWTQAQSFVRLHADGACLAISAPIDALYTACDVAELAWDCCAAELQSQTVPDWSARLVELQQDLRDEANPRLIALLEQARLNKVTCLVDDDEISLGMGRHSKVWSVDKIPDSDALDWGTFADIPTAYVTGTNGKSTSVRLADQIAKAAGFCSGVTSTDFIRVGDEVIDQGDYSGPGGARTLLRDPRAEMAFLEVARGGILRRGLPVANVDAALITNVASDHLGQYGINSVSELAEAKFVVAKALQESAVLVVNADNDYTQKQGLLSNKTLCWFSCDHKHPLIQQQLKHGGRAVFVREQHFYYHEAGETVAVCAVNDVPMTMSGSARHNIENALGVIGLTRALGLPMTAIVEGLRRFGSTAADNPGRGNTYQLEHCKVIVDFAHNQHSMSAVVEMVKKMPARRRLVMFGHAGDRTDKDIKDLTDAVADLNADHYLIAELENYLRGRELGDLPTLMRSVLGERGVKEDQITVATDPLQGAQEAVKQAGEGDVVLLFVLDMRQAVHEWLTQQSKNRPA